MADTEVRKVLNISTEKGERSIRNLRKEINDLKSALLNLDTESKDYQITLGRLADKSFEMREMNEQIRYSANDLGEKIGTVTKTLSSATQVFGGLKGAMQLVGVESESLDKAMADMVSIMSIVNGLNGIDGFIKNIGRLNIQFSDSIKAVKGFITGLSGVQKALLATGIGAFVVLLGTIIAYWDDITEAFSQPINKDNLEYFKKINEEVKKYKEGNKEKAEEKLNEEKKKELENEYKILQILKEEGITYQELLEREKKKAEAAEEAEKAKIKAKIEAAKADQEENKKEIEETERLYKHYAALAEKYNSLRYRVIKTSYGNDLKKLYKEKVTIENALADYENELKLKEKEIYVKKGEKELDNIKKIQEETANYFKTDRQKRKEKYEAELALLKKYNADTTDLTRRWQEEDAELAKKENEKRDEERKKNLEYLKNRVENIRKAYLTEEQLLSEKYNKDVELANKTITNKKDLDDTLLALQKEYNDKIDALRKEDFEKWEAEAEEAAQDVLTASEGALAMWQPIIEGAQKELSELLFETGIKYDEKELGLPKSKFDYKNVQAEQQLAYERQQALNQIELDGINEHILNLQYALDNESIIGKERDDLDQQLLEAKQARREKEIQIEKDAAERTAQIQQSKKATFDSYFNSVAQSFQSLGGLITQISQMQIDAHKDDEKAQEKYRENAKTGIIISTIGSAALAAKQGWEFPWPLGIIMAPLLAASAIATGAMQIQQLNNNTLSSSSSASVTPSLNYGESLPSGYYRNLLGDKETEDLNKNTRVYVVESDITEKQNLVKVIEGNSSF